MSQENLSRRGMLSTVGAAAAVALGSRAVAADEKSREGNRELSGTRCLVTMQFSDFDPEALSDEAKARVFLDKFVPIIAQEMVRTRSQPRTRGCSVSGTVSSGPGGVSGSGTITCTF